LGFKRDITWAIVRAVKMGWAHRVGPSALYCVGRAIKNAWKNDPIFLGYPTGLRLGHWACGL